jgi:dTDP-4-dehydrorhamnose reductase
MILLLGASGYIGRIFSTELRLRGCAFIPLTRKAVDYTNFGLLFDYVRKTRPAFIINAAGYPGKPDVEACELAREETLFANTILPQTVAKVCLMTNTPWGHISSANIYSGAKVVDGGVVIIERNFNRSELLRLFVKHPEKVCGFTEWDEPNFSFRNAPCNFYSGTKALAEEAIRGVGRHYIWRLGIPFNERDEHRNFLSRIQNHARIYDGLNALSHTDDFVRACIDLWERQAPFGIYNVSNPGTVTTRQVVETIQRMLEPNRHLEFREDGAEYYHDANQIPRSNCALDSSKLLAAGIKMRPVQEALQDALRKWQAGPSVPELARSAARPASFLITSRF